MLIFWDIDGTLMYCGGDGTKALNQVFLERYGIWDAFAGIRVGSAMDAVLLRKVMGVHGIAEKDRVLIESEYYSTLKVILSNNPGKKVLPGVIAILEYINNKDGWYNLLITSNFQEAARIKLDSVDLWRYFQDAPSGGFGDVYGEKWDVLSDAISCMNAYLGCVADSGNVCIVGDGVYDIRSAKRLGARHIAVATGWTAKEILESEQPDVLLDDLSDFDLVLNFLL